MRAIQLTFYLGLLGVIILTTHFISSQLANDYDAFNAALEECESVGGDYVTFRSQSICFMPGTIYKTAEESK